MSSRNVTKLFINNLPWTVGNRELKNYFAEFGRVINSVVVFNKDTGISKGYGFIKYFNSEAYEKIKNQKIHVIDGWAVSIQLSTAMPKH